MKKDTVSIVLNGKGEHDIFIAEFIKEIETLGYVTDVARDSPHPMIYEYFDSGINILLNRRHCLANKHKRLFASVKTLFMQCAALTINVPTLGFFITYDRGSRLLGIIKFQLNTKLPLPELSQSIEAIPYMLLKQTKIDFPDHYIDDPVYSQKTNEWEVFLKEKEAFFPSPEFQNPPG